MNRRFAVETGVWRIEQDERERIRLIKFGGNIVEEWQGERMYSFNELHDILAQKTYEKRGEK